MGAQDCFKGGGGGGGGLNLISLSHEMFSLTSFKHLI